MNFNAGHQSRTVDAGEEQMIKPPNYVRRRRFTTIVRVWIWEILTWLLSTLAMVSIAALLVSFKDQPKSKWKAVFELSTIVAALSQVAQSALLVSVAACISQLKWSWLKNDQQCRARSASAMDIDHFDEASRGPNGSFLMLLRMRRPGLVHLGAFVTVAMLAFSAFSQASVTIDLRQVSLPHVNATIRRSLGFFGQGDRIQQTLSSSKIDMVDLVTALDRGLGEQTVTLSDVLGTCPTSFCSWEPYKTLAICVETEEIPQSDIIAVYNDSGALYLRPNLDSPQVPLLPPLGIMGSEINNIDNTLLLARAERNPTIDASPEQDVSGQNKSFCNTFHHTFPCILRRNNSNPNPGRTLWKPNEGLGMIFAAYFPLSRCDFCPSADRGCQSPDLESTSMRTRNISNWQTYKATFTPCVQTLSSVYNMTTNTTVLHVENIPDWTVDLSLSDFDGLIPGYSATDSDGQQYSITAGMNMFFEANIFSGFNGSAGFFRRNHREGGHYTGDIMPYMMRDIIGTYYNDCKSDPTRGYNGFARRMNNVAIALTNAFRIHNATTTVNGQAWVTEQYYQIQFLWLIFPLAVYLGGTMLLFLTLIQSRDATIPIWKSSPLVLLGITNRDIKHDNLSAMEREARKKEVRFLQTEKGWRLETKGEGLRRAGAIGVKSRSNMQYEDDP